MLVRPSHKSYLISEHPPPPVILEEVPLPISDTENGLLVASLSIVSVSDFVPTVVGAKVTLIVHVPPTGISSVPHKSTVV